jgi:hypothetical protein
MRDYIARAETFLKRHTWWVVGLLALGVLLRFVAMRRGHNFDMDSWRLSADITAHHGNVYAETYRYNYGPIWFEILHALDRIAQLFPNPYHAFRFLVVGLLTLADVGIWYLLKRRFGYVAGFLFFLNPISIIITGYHNQFDTLAILAALASMIVYGDDERLRLTKRKWQGLALLGVSLTLKHVFFLFPLWLAVRQKGWREKLIVLGVPIGIFLLSFAPFVVTGHQGIIKNVLGYASFNNAPFWFVVVPQFIQAFVNIKVLFFGALVVFAFIMRRRPVVESVLMYSVVLVVFSTAITNQYLAIVCAAIAVMPNIFFVLYAFSGTLMLSMSAAGLHMSKTKALLPGPLTQSLTAEATYRAYDIPLFFLALGLLWHFQRQRIIAGTRWLGRWAHSEIRYQIQSLKR